MEYRYTAIVLKKREIGETDRLYTFMTREGGKVRAKAVGVRKSEAKLASSLETLMLSDIAIVRGKGKADRREDLKKRDASRETARVLKNR